MGDTNFFSATPEIDEEGSDENGSTLHDHNLYPMEEDNDDGGEPQNEPAQGDHKKPDINLSRKDPAKKNDPKKPEGDGNWEKRYKDLQSFTDKRLRQMEAAMKQKEDSVSGLIALQEHIKSNPELIQVLEASLEGKPLPVARTQANQEQTIQIPPKPADFDPADMYDPTTPSGKWAAAVQQAQQQAIVNNVMSTVVGAIDQRFGKMESERKREFEEAERQRKSQMAERQIKDYFDQHPEMGEEEKGDLLAFIAQGPGRPLSIEELDILRRVTNGRGIDPSVIDQKVTSSKKPQPSFTKTPSQNEKKKTDGDIFSLALLGSSKKKWKIV